MVAGIGGEERFEEVDVTIGAEYSPSISAMYPPGEVFENGASFTAVGD